MSRIILFTILFILTPIALAEEAPKYNFATTTAAGTILIQPGETLKVPAIYFFNIYGNRITYVNLYLTNAPKGWDVKIEPEIQKIQVNVSGTIIPVDANLYVVPSQPVKDASAIVPEGIVFITLGGIEGNIPAKVAYLNITVPQDTPLGGTYPVSIRAVGSWLGQAATVALSQERSFDFKVQTVTHSFTEEVVQTIPEEKKESDYSIYLIILLLAIAAMSVGFYAGRKKK